MPTIVHFEIPSDDVERTIKFYTELFDWKIQKAPGEMEYWFISTGEEPSSCGSASICGGLMKRQAPQHTITNYIGVSSVDDYVKKVETLGGTIVMPKTAVPQFGYFAVCL
ncbi:glyoxalase/bleomycin resistance protein/Dioxygenase, partial [Candidatus Magnetoovum chiemensis]